MWYELVFFFGEFLVILVKYLILLKMTLDTLQQNCLVASSVLSYNYYTVPYELCHVLTENWQTWHRQFLWWRRPNVSLKGVRFSQQFFWEKNYIFTIFLWNWPFQFSNVCFLKVEIIYKRSSLTSFLFTL